MSGQIVSLVLDVVHTTNTVEVIQPRIEGSVIF